MPALDHILVVDDDAEIRALLSEYLHRNGYRVSTAADGKSMLAALDAKTPDLIVLDLMMPGEDGLTLCRNLRSKSSIPIIIRFAGWTLDVQARHLVSPEQVVVLLSGVEFKLLSAFLTHPNTVLTRDQLIDLMMSRDATPFDRAIDVQVSRLRQRLRDDAKHPALIKTVRGEGYVFAANVETAG